MPAGKKVFYSILWAVSALIIAELLLQVRSHLRYGTSVFNLLSQSTTYEYNEPLGLKLLRPNATIDGSQATIRTNSLGLRSPEISHEKKQGEIRIAIIGASSVMGTYTRNNEDMISYRLEEYLASAFPKKEINVINAGIAGYGLTDQRQLLERLVQPMKPDLLIWYSGFNDISGYCHKPRSKNTTTGLPKLKLPSWLLSIELVTKNSVGLRTVKAGKQGMLDPSTLDVSGYLKRVNAFLSSVQSLGVPVLTVTNARAFRDDMPLDKQMRLSETARYYNHCFDLDGLHSVYDRHNALLAEASLNFGYPVLRLNQQIPGGSKYFGDATHFSVEGSDYVANLFTKHILELGRLERGRKVKVVAKTGDEP
jgi:lysophospholipase L1-like esterase